jgi:hypothetical protein
MLIFSGGAGRFRQSDFEKCHLVILKFEILVLTRREKEKNRPT